MSHDIAQFSEDVVTKLEEEDYPLKLLSKSDGLNDLLQSIECDVIVAGASEPTIADLSLMKCLRYQQQLTEVIVISIREDVSNAVKLMKAGDFDVLPLPINPSHLIKSIHDAIGKFEEKKPNKELKKEPKLWLTTKNSSVKARLSNSFGKP